jgi:hypothetical protein
MRSEIELGGRRLTSWSAGLLLGLAVLLAGTSVRASSPATEGSPANSSAVLVRDTAGDGIKVARKDVLFGNPRSCSAPAEVNMEEALRHTPEGRKIEDEGIRKGTARYSILAKKGFERIRRAIKTVAVAEGRDCVVKMDSIQRKPEGMEVRDLTDAVIEELDS